MVNKKTENNIEQDAQNTFKLPISGKTVVMDDVSKANGHMLFKARKRADDIMKIGLYLICELCTFDGEKITPDDILDMDEIDVNELENRYIEAKKKLILMPKT